MTSFALDTQNFQGPLDALLDMIEARKLSVSSVSLAQVCDAYLAYVERLPELPLGETAQFILIASTLLLIKSRSLLPTLELSEDERESVEELERRLARLKIVRAGANILKKEWGRAPLTFARRAPARPAIFSPADTSLGLIASAIGRLVQALPVPEKLVEASVAPVLALEEVVINLKKRLASAVRTQWSELIRGASKHDAIVHFLAILELVRSGSASVTQEKLFSDIMIEAETSGAPRYGV